MFLLRLIFLGMLAIPQFPAKAAEDRLVGLIQYDADSHFGDTLRNLWALTVMAEEAVVGGARLLVFPEGSTHGYVNQDEAWCTPGLNRCGQRSCRDVRAVAEPLPGGSTTNHWQIFASVHNAHVVYSVIESEGSHFYNSVGVVGPYGFAGKYRKRVLYGPDRCYASSGNKASLIDTPLGRFGFLICADANYAKFFKDYRMQGADAVIVAMDWDQNPKSGRAAKFFFQEMAGRSQMPIYASDTPAWDGTGYYSKDGLPRQRNGLPDHGTGIEGISYHQPATTQESPASDQMARESNFNLYFR